MKMRAKMQVIEVTSNTTTPMQEVKMAAVCGNQPFGPNGESEDNTFAQWTPCAVLSMSINNPALVGKIVQGQKFYVDFTPAEN
jgi:hypothetical protein